MPLDETVLITTYDRSTLIRCEPGKPGASAVGPNPPNLGSITSTGIEGTSIAPAESDHNTRDAIREAVDACWHYEPKSNGMESAQKVCEARQGPEQLVSLVTGGVKTSSGAHPNCRPSPSTQGCRITVTAAPLTSQSTQRMIMFQAVMAQTTADFSSSFSILPEVMHVIARPRCSCCIYSCYTGMTRYNERPPNGQTDKNCPIVYSKGDLYAGSLITFSVPPAVATVVSMADWKTEGPRESAAAWELYRESLAGIRTNQYAKPTLARVQEPPCPATHFQVSGVWVLLDNYASIMTMLKSVRPPSEQDAVACLDRRYFYSLRRMVQTDKAGETMVAVMREVGLDYGMGVTASSLASVILKWTAAELHKILTSPEAAWRRCQRTWPVSSIAQGFCDSLKSHVPVDVNVVLPAEFAEVCR